MSKSNETGLVRDSVHFTGRASPEPIVSDISTMDSRPFAAETVTGRKSGSVRSRRWRSKFRFAFARRKDNAQNISVEEKGERNLRTHEKRPEGDNLDRQDHAAISSHGISICETHESHMLTSSVDHPKPGTYSPSPASPRNLKNGIREFFPNLLRGIKECSCCSSEHILVTGYYL